MDANSVALVTAVAGAISAVGNIISTVAGNDQNKRTVAAMTAATTELKDSRKELSGHFKETQAQTLELIRLLGDALKRKGKRG